MALRGIPSYAAESRVWAIAMPPSPLTTLRPRLPPVPVPERTMQIARSFRSCASERKKKSIGRRKPRGAPGSSSCSFPFSKAMSRFGGMT